MYCTLSKIQFPTTEVAIDDKGLNNKSFFHRDRHKFYVDNEVYKEVTA